MRCLRRLGFRSRIRAGNTSSWSKNISGCGFRIPIEATLGKIFCEPFSERQVFLWQSGKIFHRWSRPELSRSLIHMSHLAHALRGTVKGRERVFKTNAQAGG
jgi:hypothetical protein